MSQQGTLVGNADVSFNFASSPDANQAVFTAIWRFFNGVMRSSSYAQLVAVNYGSGGGSTNYADENNPFGENAFQVWRLPSGSSLCPVDVYVMFQWADSSAFGSSPGDPGLLNGGTADGVGVAVAYRDDGGSPWNGTTVGSGSDTKGTPVWTEGTSKLRIFP